MRKNLEQLLLVLLLSGAASWADKSRPTYAPSPSEASDEKVTLTIWSVPNLLERDITLIGSLKDIVVRLDKQQRLIFEPEEFVRNGSKSCHLVENPPQSCKTNCLYRGRYCAVGEGDEYHENVTGAQIVMESARRQCIWTLYEKTLGPANYFSYLEHFSKCGCDSNMTVECLEATYNQLGLNMDDIDACVTRNEDLPNDGSTNALLERQVHLAETTRIGTVPKVLVNGVPLQFPTLTAEAVFRVLCGAYQKGFIPDICDFCLDMCSDDVVSCVRDLSCHGESLKVEEASHSIDFNNQSRSSSTQSPVHLDGVHENTTTTLLTMVPSPTQQTNKDVSIPNTDVSPTAGFDKLTNLVSGLGMDTYAMFGNCGINMDAPMPVVQSIRTGELEDLESGAGLCGGDDVKQFHYALQKFERSAGFDLAEWTRSNAKSFGVAVSGCMRELADPTGTNGKIAQECVNLFLKNGSLSRSIANFLQWNTAICPALSQLEQDIPLCILQEQQSAPALDGPLVQLSACLVAKICGHLDSMCQKEVEELNQCLPRLKDESRTCHEIIEKCNEQGALLFALPSPLLGASFPDRCQSFAIDGDGFLNARIVERYNAYRRRCILDQSTAEDIRAFGDPNEHRGSTPLGKEPTHKTTAPEGTRAQSHFLGFRTREGMVLALGSTLGLMIGCAMMCTICIRLCCTNKKFGVYNALQTEDRYDMKKLEKYESNFDDPPSW